MPHLGDPNELSVRTRRGHDIAPPIGAERYLPPAEDPTRADQRDNAERSFSARLQLSDRPPVVSEAQQKFWKKKHWNRSQRKLSKDCGGTVSSIHFQSKSAGIWRVYLGPKIVERDTTPCLLASDAPYGGWAAVLANRWQTVEQFHSCLKPSAAPTKTERSVRSLHEPKAGRALWTETHQSFPKEVRFQDCQFSPRLPRAHGKCPEHQDDREHVNYRDERRSGSSSFCVERTGEDLLRAEHAMIQLCDRVSTLGHGNLVESAVKILHTIWGQYSKTLPVTVEEFAWLSRQRQPGNAAVPPSPERLSRPPKFEQFRDEYDFFPGQHTDGEKCVYKRYSGPDRWEYLQGRKLEVRRLGRISTFGGTPRYVPLRGLSSAPKWILALTPQNEKYFSECGTIQEKVDKRLKQFYDKALKRSFEIEWKKECAWAKSVGLPEPARPEYFSEPRERYTNSEYKSVVASNSASSTYAHGRDETGGWNYRVVFDGPQTTRGGFEMSRREARYYRQRWFLDRHDSGYGLSAKTFNRFLVCEEIQFNGLSVAEGAAKLGLAVDTMSEILSIWRKEVFAMRRKKLFAFENLFARPLDDQFRDIVNNGGFYVVLPKLGPQGRRDFEMHKLGQPGDLGMRAGLAGDTGESVPGWESALQAAVDMLQERLVREDIDEIEVQVQMQRSSRKRNTARRKAQEFRAWQFKHAEIEDFGLPGELQERLSRVLAEAKLEDPEEDEDLPRAS